MASLAARAKRSEQYAQTGEDTPKPPAPATTPVAPKLVAPTPQPTPPPPHAALTVPAAGANNDKQVAPTDNAVAPENTAAANTPSGFNAPEEAPKPAPAEPGRTPAQENYGIHVPETQRTSAYTAPQTATPAVPDANVRVQPANNIMAINVYNTLHGLNKEKLVRVASFFKNDGTNLDEATVAVINYNPAIKNLLRNFKAMTELKVGHYQALAALYVRDLFDNENGEQTVSALYDLVTALTDSKAEKPTSPTEYSLSISEEAQKIDETVYDAVATVEELIKIVDKS